MKTHLWDAFWGFIIVPEQLLEEQLLVHRVCLHLWALHGRVGQALRSPLLQAALPELCDSWQLGRAVGWERKRTHSHWCA